MLVRPETQTRRTLSPVDLSPATSPASSHDRHVPAMDTFEPFDNRLGDVPKNPEVMGSGYSKQGVIPRERSAACLPLEKTFSASVRLSECDVRLLRDRILLRRPPPPATKKQCRGEILGNTVMLPGRRLCVDQQTTQSWGFHCPSTSRERLVENMLEKLTIVGPGTVGGGLAF